MTITAADLQPFCSAERFREYLHRPWSKDGFTYATNGHVLIRVARLNGVEENDKAPDTDVIFAAAADQTATQKIPKGKIPKVRTIECPSCNGRGREHDCPDCTCECEKCDGTGRNEERISVGILGAIYKAKYISQLLIFPGLRFSSSPPVGGPARFVFDGGEGAIMPMRFPYPKHREIVPARAEAAP